MRRIENDYGLTFAEWCAAANLGRDGNDLVSVGKAGVAWRAGEDPTEYAAAPRGTFATREIHKRGKAPVEKPKRRAKPKRKRADC